MYQGAMEGGREREGSRSREEGCIDVCVVVGIGGWMFAMELHAMPRLRECSCVTGGSCRIASAQLCMASGS